MTQCLSCELSASPRHPSLPGGRHVYQDAYVSCNHYIGSDAPGDTADARSGWFIVSPRRHVTRLFDLTEIEFARISAVSAAVDQALTTEYNVGRTLMSSLGWYREDHIHFHIVPTALGETVEGEIVYPEVTNGWLNFGGTTAEGSSLYVPLRDGAEEVARKVRVALAYSLGCGLAQL